MKVAALVEQVLGPDVPIAFDAYDGSHTGPDRSDCRVIIRSPAALMRLVTSPGELGLGRAYAAADLEIEGDIFAALALRDRLASLRLNPAQLARAAALAAQSGLHRVPPAPGEARLHGRRHSRRRDAAAIAHHYDVSNRFYRLVLGPSMTYSCAVWAHPAVGLEAAQSAKHDLVCRKLALKPGMRLLDVGCGWGSMAIHAAKHYGARAVGVTLSARQAAWARDAVAAEGLAGRVEIRRQDYRDVADGPYDAISSIGMVEHVGTGELPRYFGCLHRLLRPHGRLLNHGISRPPQPRIRHAAGARRNFVTRFVFPDGELSELGQTVSRLQEAGFEARHVESLREHYALTLRAWVARLEGSWTDAVAEAGPARARIWRLYLAASALNFEAGRTTIFQVLAARPERGRSGFPLRPDFEKGNKTRDRLV